MRIRDLLFRNFWWKLASLIMASLIWFNWSDVYKSTRYGDSQANAAKLDTRTLKDMPVLLVTTAGDVKLFKTDPGSVTVRLEGEWDDLLAVDPKNVHVWVFVADPTKAAGAALPVEVSGLPYRVSVGTIEPDRVTLERPDH